MMKYYYHYLTGYASTDYSKTALRRTALPHPTATRTHNTVCTEVQTTSYAIWVTRAKQRVAITAWRISFHKHDSSTDLCAANTKTSPSTMTDSTACPLTFYVLFPVCNVTECYVVGKLSSRTRYRVLAVAALAKSLSMVWWRWHISVSQLCCWSTAVSFWVASITVCVCFGVPPRECRSLN